MTPKRCDIAGLLNELNAPMSGAELKRLRRRLGCTQPELAFLLNLHPVTISAYERGAYEIPVILAVLMRLLTRE